MNMNNFRTSIFTAAAIAAISFTGQALAQSDDAEELKIAAIEALIVAPPERALPLAAKALQGNHSDEVKERALFILSQIDLPEAQDILLETARQGSGEIRLEAIRMIGIGGNRDALAQLGGIYDSGDEEVREAVLEAYLIADDENAVYDQAVRAHSAGNEEDFEAAVEMLGVMGASEQLRKLRESTGNSEALIEAYIISGDADSLREIALDGSDPEIQAEAIEALGIVGGDDVNATLIEIYKNSDSEDIRESALEGMLISGYDEGVLELYRSSQDPAEKRELLQLLVIMGSDDVWDVIDSALDGGL
jgi:HEAT repeat protein